MRARGGRRGEEEDEEEEPTVNSHGLGRVSGFAAGKIIRYTSNHLCASDDVSPGFLRFFNRASVALSMPCGEDRDTFWQGSSARMWLFKLSRLSKGSPHLGQT